MSVIDADHHEVELERWLQAEPDDREREQAEYPVPAADR